ncbi:hypothetical protein H5410_003486 [Solanum commersonii]|uniref:Uncharacterized protein n=1 Tax=Solanum commersonii TaxID=4109 RepID=A0A9J6B513_SOLCO|nr:hypothetical protein H5410_003486 [Solanum commersonii]
MRICMCNLTLTFLKGTNVLKFDIFNRIGEPHTYLRAYYDKLVGVGSDERVCMKLFIRSLSGEALAWYTQQDLPVNGMVGVILHKNLRIDSRSTLTSLQIGFT